MPPFRRVLEQPYHNHGLELLDQTVTAGIPLTVVGYNAALCRQRRALAIT
jgi:hypothetical protein